MIIQVALLSLKTQDESRYLFSEGYVEAASEGLQEVKTVSFQGYQFFLMLLDFKLLG